MKCLFLIVTAILLFNAPAIAADANPSGYLSGLLSNIPKAQGSLEATGTLDVYKVNVMACFAVHVGSESFCATLDFPPTTAFNYVFSQAPQDGSKSWALKAYGNNQGVFDQNDTVIITSDDSGNTSCIGSGRLPNAC